MFLREQFEVNMIRQSIVQQIYTKYLIFRKYHQEKIQISIFEKSAFNTFENQIIINLKNGISSKISIYPTDLLSFSKTQQTY